MDAPHSVLKNEDNWRAFIGEEAALEVLHAETPDSPSKRCILKARGRREPGSWGTHVRAGRRALRMQSPSADARGFQALKTHSPVGGFGACLGPLLPSTPSAPAGRLLTAGHQAGGEDAADERQDGSAAWRGGPACALRLCGLPQEPHLGAETGQRLSLKAA